MRNSVLNILRIAITGITMLTITLVPVMAPAQESQPFSREQIDQLVAPIALYPDTLLSQVLMASTYPADVADAAKWSKSHSSMKGDDAVKAVDSQQWDPSVKAIVAFPQVLQMMGEKPDWVQKLGDAFLASSKDVLDSAQRLRAQAQKAGNLKSSEQQKVVVDQSQSTQVIKIEPANPEVVYVPTYNPTVVYGAWPYPAYPPYYFPPPPAYYPGAALASGIAFGIGVGIVASLWSDCDWHHGDIDINVNKYNNINVHNKISANQTKFQHNSANRRGVPYRDQASRQKYGKSVPGASQRADFRGRDQARDAQRRQAQGALQQRGMDPARERAQLQNDPKARELAQNAARDTGRNRTGNSVRSQGQMRGAGDNALHGAGNGRQMRQQIDRGNASRASMAQRGGGMSRGGARAGGFGRHR
ncbi:DUF3300 domain-containing protein [Oxalicibacterium solurbis]|uniref:Membrane protein n=1 Tax=Oxalicibacterium solurbis TaxID=69280 RepID=A0A8J3B0W2_9BURK|nr:DUF3300 domain-containing protein [Oxalicibacterium solurbis]GGI52844.1 membrane protein [Oxalicibacterium solurbis]